MLQNESFAKWSGSTPSRWAIAPNDQQVAQDTVDGKTALHARIVKDGGKFFGEIRQAVKVKPNSVYIFTGDVKGTKDGLGFFQVKTRLGNQALKRISSEFNKGTDWCHIEKKIETGQATELQILCRFRQQAAYVGAEAWFTNLALVLEGTDPGAGQSRASNPSSDSNAASPVVPVTAAPIQLQTASAGKDVYVTPNGSGSNDGSNWDNAMAGNGGGLQQAWDAAGPGNTVYVGSGTYNDTQLQINAGGNDAFHPITLQGVDTGKGLPRFVSTWDKSQPARGMVLIRLAETVGHIQIASLRIEHYMIGVVLAGRNVGVRICDVDATDVREGFIFNGGATSDQPEQGTHDVLLSGCKVVGYTKRFLRIRNGVSLVRVVDCVADSGGKAYATEPFQIGYHIEGSKLPGVSDRDISFINCTARNNYHDKGEKYWNADGFCTEENVNNVTYIRCRSFDNTDGKAYNSVFVDCIALRNKRNFRVWSDGLAVFTNCVGAYAIKRGGSGTADGIHINLDARVIATNCTFVGNDIGVDMDTTGHDNQPHKGLAQLRNCIIASNTQPITIETGSQLMRAHCIVDSQKLDPDVLPSITQWETRNEDPKLISPKSQWEGGDEAFDSLPFKDTGYHSH
jgi:hypothetical protein